MNAHPWSWLSTAFRVDFYHILAIMPDFFDGCDYPSREFRDRRMRKRFARLSSSSSPRLGSKSGPIRRQIASPCKYREHSMLVHCYLMIFASAGGTDESILRIYRYGRTMCQVFLHSNEQQQCKSVCLPDSNETIFQIPSANPLKRIKWRDSMNHLKEVFETRATLHARFYRLSLHRQEEQFILFPRPMKCLREVSDGIRPLPRDYSDLMGCMMEGSEHRKTDGLKNILPRSQIIPTQRSTEFLFPFSSERGREPDPTIRAKCSEKSAYHLIRVQKVVEVHDPPVLPAVICVRHQGDILRVEGALAQERQQSCIGQLDHEKG
ncbi:unnamed protein product [Protopolystoma xenopodis]|uniref:Uncharacterized protein n=1 Tax=Protopolystoma xenopodis TaxID=117903 RepID=A0A3S5CGS6_9PLAT|nr:unnamed protein product [Protopolystoma xenopodis]